MNNQFTSQRKWSAVFALILALVVSFMAAIQSFGTTSEEELIVYDIKSSLDRAYEEVIADESYIQFETADLETIKIFNQNDQLILKVLIQEDGRVEDEKAQQMINRANYLGSYSNTTIYKVVE